MSETATSRQWNVKGVDAQTRIVARDAAAAAHLAMGAWIDRAIKRAVAAQLPTSPLPSEPNASARPSSIERAVAHKLESLEAPVPAAPVPPQQGHIPDRYPRSAPRDNLGRVALIGIAVFLIGGLAWLVGDRMQPRSIVSQPGPSAQIAAPPTSSEVRAAASQAPSPVTLAPASGPSLEPAAASTDTIRRAIQGDDGLNTQELVEIQRLLSRLDLDPGAADGMMNRETEKAISTFQTMAGITVDGKPSTALLEELRAVAEAAKR